MFSAVGQTFCILWLRTWLRHLRENYTKPPEHHGRHSASCQFGEKNSEIQSCFERLVGASHCRLQQDGFYQKTPDRWAKALLSVQPASQLIWRSKKVVYCPKLSFVKIKKGSLLSKTFIRNIHKSSQIKNHCAQASGASRSFGFAAQALWWISTRTVRPQLWKLIINQSGCCTGYDRDILSYYGIISTCCFSLYWHTMILDRRFAPRCAAIGVLRARIFFPQGQWTLQRQSFVFRNFDYDPRDLHGLLHSRHWGLKHVGRSKLYMCGGVYMSTLRISWEERAHQRPSRRRRSGQVDKKYLEAISLDQDPNRSKTYNLPSHIFLKILKPFLASRSKASSVKKSISCCTTRLAYGCGSKARCRTASLKRWWKSIRISLKRGHPAAFDI